MLKESLLKGTRKYVKAMYLIDYKFSLNSAFLNEEIPWFLMTTKRTTDGKTYEIFTAFFAVYILRQFHNSQF